MTRTRFNFFLDDYAREGLLVVKERDGISESEQIRRAIAAWLKSKGVTERPERKRADTRKRP